MPSTSYLGRGVAKMAGNHILPGSGDFASSAAANITSSLLLEIQQEFFQDTTAYNGGDIPKNDALKAIKYARSKKLTKSHRKAVIGGTKMAGFVVGAATGATLGSVVPVAGTIAGGVGGGIAVGAAVSGGVSLLDQMKRKAKGLYKIIRKTRGEHRHQAADALAYCHGNLNRNDVKHKAATAALIVILGDEFDKVMAMSESAMIERLADRLKSN